jgi:serine/threonine protein kinase
MRQSVGVPSQIRQYVLSDFLGRGAFSVVCRALNKANKETYACKILSRQSLADPSDLARFQREVNAMAFIRHQNVVALYDFFADDSNFYLIMDLCSGGELYQYICANGAMDEPTAALIFRQVVAGVCALHDHGVAHRDLKPENIMFDAFPHVKVSDFGLCGYVGGGVMAQSFVGSPCYCSPECLCRVKYDGRHADVWSLGVILFTMVTGSVPWTITNTSVMIHQILKGAYQIPMELSAQCAGLIRAMLKVNPQERATLEEVEAHSWLLCSEKSTWAPDVRTIEMRERPQLTVAMLSELTEQDGAEKDQGVVSPFEPDARSALPKLRLAGKYPILRTGSMGAIANELRNSQLADRLGSGSEAGTKIRLRAARLLLPKGVSSPKRQPEMYD